MTEGEGLLIADCDMALITKRKRMMDSVGHYARPELLQLHVDARPATAMVQHFGDRASAAVAASPQPIMPPSPLLPAKDEAA